VSTRQSRFNVGDTIDGKYEVVKVLPVGGMGELYKVRHVHLNDFRAVKVLKKNLLSDATQKQRFLREAKIAASIKHPNLASLYDFSSLQDGSYYMVQEFIDGVTLAERMRSGERFDVPFVLRLAQQVLGGIAALHEEGIIHRDISPDNLMLTRTSSGATNIKIIDLGIAKPMDAGEGLTSAGFFVGKLHYASPEQAGMIAPGERVDNRTDLYSLGVVLYKMVAGRMPFAADSPQSYFMKQVSEEVLPITPPGEPPVIPPEVEQYILKLLRKNRNERFSSAAEALEHLSMISARHTTGALPQPPLPAAAPLPPPFAEEEPGETVVSPLADLRGEADRALAAGPFGASADEPVFSDHLYGDETELAGEGERITAEHPLVQEEPSGWDAPADATMVVPQMEMPQSSMAAQILGAGAAATGEDSASRRAAAPPSSMPTMVETPLPPASLPTMVETPVPPASMPTMVETPLPPGTVVQSYDSAPPPGGGAVPPPYPGGAPVPAKRGRSGLLVAFMLILLLLLGVAAAAAYFLFIRPAGRPDLAATLTAAATPEAVATPVPTPIPMITPDIYVPLDTSLTATDTSFTSTDVPMPNIGDIVATPTVRPSPTASKKKRAATPTPTAAPVVAEATPTPAPTPPPVREGDLVRSGDPGVRDARITRWHPATYPRAAERLRASGTTEVQVLVGINGQPEQVRVSKSSGNDLLDQEAQNVARRSTYAAAQQEGVRVRMWIPVRVTFERP
jgi:TonB family protein